MDINAPTVKQHRSERAWTQQHLADACGVSLRTIQRVERYGTASNETLMSLAAVFEIEQKLLMVEQQPQQIDEPEQSTTFGMLPLLAMAATFGALVGGLSMYFVMA